MHRKTASVASIEANIDTPRQQYISNLKKQCLMQEEASQVAEALISTYQHDNHTLRQQLATLSEQLSNTQQQLQAAQEDLRSKNFQLSQMHQLQSSNRNLEKTVLKYSERVNQLLEQNLVLEQQVRSLQKQLDKERSNRLGQKKVLKNKLFNHQRQKLQGHFRNFLRLGQPSQSEQSLEQSHKRSRQQRQDGAVRVLEWKLKQKEEQIVILLKRLRGMEDNSKPTESGRRKQRVLTADSIDNFYSVNSHQRKNVSQFTH